jgi:hypothetical protein
MTTDAAAPAEVGALWSRVWAEGLRRAREARARIPAGRWLDVEYADLVADPVGVVEAIYQAFGHRFPRELAGAIRTHVAAHPGGRSPIEYSLADMGLDAETERRRFAADAALPEAPLPRGRR